MAARTAMSAGCNACNGRTVNVPNASCCDAPPLALQMLSRTSLALAMGGSRSNSVISISSSSLPSLRRASQFSQARSPVRCSIPRGMVISHRSAWYRRRLGSFRTYSQRATGHLACDMQPDTCETTSIEPPAMLHALCAGHATWKTGIDRRRSLRSIGSSVPHLRPDSARHHIFAP